MAKSALWLTVRGALAIFLYTILAIAALAFADYALCKRGPAGLRRLYALAHLPEHHLGQTWSTPAVVRGTLHTAAPRLTPTRVQSALWYAWVEEVRGSGKSSTTVLLCARGEDEDLELRHADRMARLDLFAAQESVALLKGALLETLPLHRVALDFGPLYTSRHIPPPMRLLCGDKLPESGNLTYYEARIQLGDLVTVLGCARADAVYSCGTPSGAISLNELAPVLRAYANDTLALIRGAALGIVIALSLLASAIFDFRSLRAAGKGGL